MTSGISTGRTRTSVLKHCAWTFLLSVVKTESSRTKRVTALWFRDLYARKMEEKDGHKIFTSSVVKSLTHQTLDPAVCEAIQRSSDVRIPKTPKRKVKLSQLRITSTARTSRRFDLLLFAFTGVNECNGDLSTS